jgi:hypothetical protein
MGRDANVGVPAAVVVVVSSTGVLLQAATAKAKTAIQTNNPNFFFIVYPPLIFCFSIMNTPVCLRTRREYRIPRGDLNGSIKRRLWRDHRYRIAFGK